MSMHYSKHCVTASMAYVITLMYASTNDQWDRLDCALFSSSIRLPCPFSSVQLRRSVRAFSKLSN